MFATHQGRAITDYLRIILLNEVRMRRSRMRSDIRDL